jgi:hypothetical protein
MLSLNLHLSRKKTFQKPNLEQTRRVGVRLLPLVIESSIEKLQISLTSLTSLLDPLRKSGVGPLAAVDIFLYSFQEQLKGQENEEVYEVASSVVQFWLGLHSRCLLLLT